MKRGKAVRPDIYAVCEAGTSICSDDAVVAALSLITDLDRAMAQQAGELPPR